ERPGGEGVGREARVHECQSRGEAGIAQVRVDYVELGRGEQRLVDHHAGGQGGEVAGGGVIGPAADGEGGAFEGEPTALTGGVGEEHLDHVGAHRLGGGPDESVGDREVPGAEQAQALLLGDPREGGEDLLATGAVAG